jgi:hypothetical protein
MIARALPEQVTLKPLRGTAAAAYKLGKEYRIPGGRFNESRSKSTIDWVVHYAKGELLGGGPCPHLLRNRYALSASLTKKRRH